MKFLFYLLTIFSFLFPVFADSSDDGLLEEIINLDTKIIHNDTEEIEHLLEDTRSAITAGAGIYFSSNLFEAVSFSLGHQFRVTDGIGFRTELEQRFSGQSVESIRDTLRYGVFIDLRLGNTPNFVYIGSHMAHGHLSRPSLSTGVIWRVGPHDGITIGHEYLTLSEITGGRAGHTLRLGFTHFFRPKK